MNGGCVECWWYLRHVPFWFYGFFIVLQSGSKRLVEGVFFEVLNQERDSVRIGPCLAAVVAGSEPVGVVCLIDKGAVGFNEFFDSRPETACKGGKDGFVDDPLLARVIGIVVDCDKVIEGFDEFGFGLGGVEVGRGRRRRRPLLPGFLLLLLSGAAFGRSFRGSRLRDVSNGRSGRLGWNNWRGCLRRLCGWRSRSQEMSFCCLWLVSGRRRLLSRRRRRPC
jgi:hypothetical protein